MMSLVSFKKRLALHGQPYKLLNTSNTTIGMIYIILTETQITKAKNENT